MHDPEANTAPRRESGTIQSVQLFLFYSSLLLILNETLLRLHQDSHRIRPYGNSHFQGVSL